MSPPPTPEARSVRVRFPLWTKLGLVFGGLLGLFLGLYGWFGFQSDLASEASRREHMLRGIATSIAAAIDGDDHRSLKSGADMKSEAYKRLRALMVTVKRENDLAWAGTIAEDDRGRQYFVGDGSSGAPYVIGYPIFDGYEHRWKALRQKATAFDPALQDEWGTWMTASAPILDSAGAAVAVMEVAIDADAQLLYAKERRHRLIVQILIAIAIAGLIAVLFARWLNRHLTVLTSSALHVAAGSLDEEVDIRTRDEIGVLGGAFNSMVVGLRERRFLRDTFGRYVSKEVASQIISQRELNQLGGELRQVTVLMSDLRGFTSLAETLGPRQTVELINRYFSRMAGAIHAHQGTIGELLGDGMVIYFGAPHIRGDDALRACACAVSMQLALAEFSREEGRELVMGIGIATGTVIVGNIGSEDRMKYGVVGSTINLAGRLEAFTLGSQVLLCDATRDAAGDALTIGKPLLMRAKGKAVPVRCHPLKAVGGTYDVQMPRTRAPVMLPCDVPVVLWEVVGKEVSDQALQGTVTRLGKKALRVSAGWAAAVRISYKLQLALPNEPAKNIYAKVSGCEPAEDEDGGWVIELSFTSIPPGERELLANFMAPV